MHTAVTALAPTHTPLTAPLLNVGLRPSGGCAQVSAAHNKLMALKDNLRQVYDVIDKWNAQPLMRRKPTATFSPADFQEQHRPFLSTRYSEVVDGGKAIHRLLLASNTELKMSKGAPAWKAYVEFVSEIVVGGLGGLVGSSLRFLAEQIDADHVAKNELLPMLELQIELLPPDVLFSPRLAYDPIVDAKAEVKSIGALVHGWIADFFAVCKLVKRLDRTEGDFLNEVHEREEIKYRVHQVRRHMHDAFAVAETLLQPFVQHKHLWTADIQAEFAHFLEGNPGSRFNPPWSPTTPSMFDNGPSEADVAAGVMKRHRSAAASAAAELMQRSRAEPDLAVFEATFAEKKAKIDEVAAMPVSLSRGWLKFDTKPAKQALSTWVTKWMFAYTQHVHDNVTNAQDTLSAFMADVHAGLDNADPDTLDDGALAAAMTHIHAVADADVDVDEMFAPLRGAVALLRKYGITISDEVLEQLEKAPYEWEDTKKLCSAAAEALAERKRTHGDKIFQDAESFTVQVQAFRQDFKQNAPFAYEVGVEDAYTQIDLWQEKIVDIERRANELRDFQHLFDAHAHAWKELHQCANDLRHLKLLWDHATLVFFTFEQWQATPWAKVDCDSYYMTGKRLQQQVVLLERRVKQAQSWGVYSGTLQALSDMLVTLPLVQDLRDDAVRERHWKKLMRIAGRTFALDDKFVLRDLLRLNCAYSGFEPAPLVRAHTHTHARTHLRTVAQGARVRIPFSQCISLQTGFGLWG
jgi:dynein heavy chain